MAKFEEIQRARKVLDLQESASMAEIDEAYRKKANLYHPDKGGSEEMMKEINQAYRLLMDYCNRYIYVFSKEDWARAYPEEAYFAWVIENWKF